METWAEQLGGLTGKQIQHGLTKLPKDFPPTPMQFRELCLGNSDHSSKAYRPFSKRTALALKPSKDVAKKHLDQIKQTLGMTA